MANTTRSGNDALSLIRIAIKERGARSVDSSDVAILSAIKPHSVVQLGFDPVITDVAKEAAERHYHLRKLNAEQELAKEELRLYGAEKRETWNELHKDEVTSVAIPYKLQNNETSYVTIVCMNRYVVNEKVKFVKSDYPDEYALLFQEHEEKVLREDAEHILIKALKQIGVRSGQIEATLDALFERRTVVSTKGDFEKNVKTLSVDAREAVEAAAKRVDPGVRF